MANITTPQPEKLLVPSYHDRTLALGGSGAGKSSLFCEFLTRTDAEEIILVDNKHDFPTPKGFKMATKPHGLVWRNPYIHYQPELCQCCNCFCPTFRNIECLIYID